MASRIEIVRRPFEPGDVDGVWYVVAAAPPEVNRAVAQAAESKCLFVNAVDDLESASAYAGAIVQKAGVTIALSTDGEAPALAGLVREALEALLPDELDRWMACAQSARREWLAQGVPMPERRPLLLQALNELYERKRTADEHGRTGARTRGEPRAASSGSAGTMTRRPSERGFVSLVGAGPGDPDLLTRKAADRLADADLVLYDALVDPATLALAPIAQRVFVGKRAGRPQVRQEFIHWLMIRAARAGKKVVRLKGGDPFVFGRGGEEGLALAAAGISFEVVPGVSSATAAAALAGIPVTHRGVASGFVVVSGHAEDAYRPILESLAPHSATVVVMMGLGRIEHIAELLLGRGWNAMTPAAVLFGASTSSSTVWTMTLLDLKHSLKRTDDSAPATVVIGDVVRLGAALGAQAEADEAAAGGQ